jgi:hypothetical protein
VRVEAAAVVLADNRTRNSTVCPRSLTASTRGAFRPGFVRRAVTEAAEERDHRVVLTIPVAMPRRAG